MPSPNMQSKQRRRGHDSSSSEYSSSSYANTSSENQDLESGPSSPQGEENGEPFFEDDNVPREEQRGKKGLTHQEMAMQRYHSATPNADAASTESDSGDDKPDRSQAPPPPPPPPPAPKRNEYVEPVVAKAAHLLDEKGLDTNAVGYARLLGAGKGAVDYLVRVQCITIGRLGFGTDCELKSEGRFVSRRHAKLFWQEKTDLWYISCLSRKGMIVDGTPLVDRAPPIPLRSQSLIEIGDVAFYFLLATGSLFRVNDVALLEKKIIDARSIREEYSDEDDFSEGYLVDEDGPYRLSNGKKVRIKKKSRPSTGRSEKSISSKKSGRVSAAPGSGKKSKGKAPVKKGKTVSESDYTSTESETEQEEEGIPDTLDYLKYRPMLIPMPAMTGKRKSGSVRSDGKKRRRKSRPSATETSGDEYESIGSLDDWSKKERADFARALFAVGVDPMYDQDGQLTHFSWSRFRGIAELLNKTDYELEDYYRRFMTDVHTLLDDEEREKRTKGPRTKHKKGCDCIVCLNTAKSRERKRASTNFEDHGTSEDDRDGKSTAKGPDKLVGLVTAQKLRVRMGIHEAALQVARDTAAASAVVGKLEASRQTADLKDFPNWWVIGYHDEALMKGVHTHGVGYWDSIWYDDAISRFVRIRDREGAMVLWPSPQAAMKRVRDISNMVTSEMKRMAKKGREMERLAKRKARRKERRQEKEKKRSGHLPDYAGGAQREADVSTAEDDSGPERDERRAADIETEDEDGVEVEVEELEVEEAEDGQSFDDDVDREAGPAQAQHATVNEANDTTDEDGEGGEDEDRMDGYPNSDEYETASDTASE